MALKGERAAVNGSINKMAKVSVIIPVYKVEQFLRECLDSVTKQTFRDLEIILVDDGSPDRCGEICDSYAKQDARIKVIHKENEGLSSARNDGIKAATSTWLLFVDSDDWIDRDYIQRLYTPGAGMYDVTICGADWEVAPGIWKKRHGLSGADIITDKDILNVIWGNSLAVKYNPLGNELKIDLIAVPWNKLYNRNLILERGIYFRQDCKVAEDAVFNLEYLRWVQKIHVCMYYGYHYRCVQGGITKRFDPERREKDEYVLSQIEEYCTNSDNPYLPEFYSLFVFHLFLINLNRYYMSSQNKIKFHGKIRMIRDTLRKEQYCNAFENVPQKALSKYQMIALIFVKNKWVFGLVVLNYFNKIRKSMQVHKNMRGIKPYAEQKKDTG